MFDVTPAAVRMSAVVNAIDDAQLTGPTPCPDYTVGDLVDHVGGLTKAFTAAATKEPLAGGPMGPSGDASRLEPGWRERIAADLATLADAWQDPAAWEGMTLAGPIELPAPIAAVVTLNELLLHGWDLAAATGQAYSADAAEVAIAREMLAPSAADNPDGVEGLFGPPVTTVSGDPLDEILGLAGRDPDWAP